MRLQLNGLSKSFGRHCALHDVQLDLSPGQIVAIVGLNGAGKSTLLHCLAGIVAPNRGAIRYDGEIFRSDRLDLRQRFGFLPDFPAFFPNHTALQHIAMTLRLYDKDGPGAEDRVLELLRDFAILPLADKPMSQLSRGQAYKAGLVALLATAPELLMFDEPFASGMDPLGLRRFRQHIRTAADAGSTILYSTQILEMAEKFSDQVCILDRGSLIALDSSAEIRSRGSEGGNLEELFAQLAEEQSE